MFSTISFDNLFGRCNEIAAVAQQILVDLTHSLVAQPFCRPNDIFGILKFKIFRFNLFIPF